MVLSLSDPSAKVVYTRQSLSKKEIKGSLFSVDINQQ